MADQFYNQRSFKESEAVAIVYSEALQTYRDLAKANPQTY
jgi:hypothetical protein